MKKLFLFTTILFQLTFVFGQTFEWSEWGSWTNCNCYSKLMFRLKSASSPKYNESNFMIEFKSNYSQTITFGWDGFNNQNEANIYFSKGAHGTQSDISLSPGKSATLSFSNKGAGSKIAYIIVYRLSLGKDYQHYQRCDNQSPCSYCAVTKDPYCPNYASSSSDNYSSGTSNNSNDLSDYNRSKADLERQMQQKNQEIANRNAEAKRQQELLRQQQEAEKLKAIEQVGGVLQNSAVDITQRGLADLQKITLLEQELRNKLKGNENRYPEAQQYFTDYLKAKKKRKTLTWIGLGGCIAGAVAVGVAVLPMLSESNEGEFNEGLMYGGIGATVAGLGLTIFTIGPSAKEKEYLQKAESYVSVNTTKNGIGLVLNF